jgi:urease accessory protein UreF
MLDQNFNMPQSAREILGDLTGLAEQLGHAGGMPELAVASASLRSAQVGTVPELQAFLERYASELLFPHELAAVAQAYGHASRRELRELIAQDNQLGNVLSSQGFAEASWQVGQRQLHHLRPLRGERLAQRYLAAVERGEAKAWHTLVFGLVLAVYSLPLRQGLVHYAHQTLGGFVESAGHRFTIPNSERVRLLSSFQQPIANAVETVVRQHSTRLLQPG